MRPAELHALSAEKGCMTEHVSSLRSVKVATPPLAPLKRLSPVDLPSADGFGKPFAASKLQKKYDGGTQFEKSCKNSFDRSLLRLDFVIP